MAMRNGAAASHSKKPTNSKKHQGATTTRNKGALVVLFFVLAWFSLLFYAYTSIGSSVVLPSHPSQPHNIPATWNLNLDHRKTNLDHPNLDHRNLDPSRPHNVPATWNLNLDHRKAMLDHRKAVNDKKLSPEPSWYGWQPEIHPQPDCSWRKCFHENHGCPTTCRDENTLGEVPHVPDDWIPDVTMLHRMHLAQKDANGNPWPPALPEELCEPIGVFGGNTDDNKLLLDAVPIVAQPPSSKGGGPKILCMIYTMANAHSTRVRAIRETWAGACDGFLAFSTETDPRIPAISIPHDGEESYDNMWQKVRSIWRYVGKHYADDFDYFFLGGDDLFVLPQNLRSYLATVGSPDDHHFIGRRFKGGGVNNYFNSGGSGYTLSRGTLKSLVATGLDHEHCNPTRKTSMEDVMIAQCLRLVFDTGLTDTRDAQGRERFHPFSPGSHYTWEPPKPGEKSDWYEEYNKEWGLKLGAECCAPDSVSFHYIKKPAMMRHMFSLLYKCKK